jgi:cytoskeletal protein CcmA (bactofilin family)
MVMGREAGTTIARGTTLRGRVRGQEDLVVAGCLEGTVELEGTLRVLAGGTVRASVQATRVVVAGSLVGDVVATALIEIAAEGQVQGDLVAPALRVEPGGRLSGTLDIGAVEAGAERVRALSLAGPARAEEAGPEVPPAALEQARRRKRILVKKRG